MAVETPDSVPSQDLLGIRVHAFTVDTLLSTIASVISEDRKAIIANVNANAMNLAAAKPWFRDFLNRAEFVFCDGSGVLLAARLLGEPLPERITYADWLPDLAGFCAERGFSLYLLGAKPGVA
ncbi:WecB/TagA/CpsF family glycosyltransferase, partial [Gemmatimonadota bacterium]